MSKKMCPEYRFCQGMFGPKKNHGGDGGCPRNANSKCEILAKKPKMVRINGRVFFTKEKHGPLCIDTCSIETTDALERAFRKHGSFRVTLSVEAKYLKEKK